MRVEHIPPERAPPTGAFAEALRLGRGEPLAFVEALPPDAGAWARRLEEAAVSSPLVPADLAARLAVRQRELGAGVRAVAAAEALADPGTLAIVTGQQPGLLGGPLLSFHKAAGAAHLARQLDGLGGRRVVPVFWLASEDHDVDEANRLLLVDRRGQPRRLSLDLRPDGRSLMHVDLPPGAVDALLREAAEILPDTERAKETLDLLRPEASDGFATWCARALVTLLGDCGLVLVEPPVLLPYAGEALAALVEDAPAIQAAVAQRARELEAAGFRPPLDPPEGEVPLFLRTSERGPRARVQLEGEERIRVRGADTTASRADVARRLREEPRLGSGDAIGRVFVQNRLLPVAAYVAGPTELTYHAQVRAAHQAVGVAYPLAVPRPEATWLDARADRTAAAFDVDVADVAAGRVVEPPVGHAGSIEGAEPLSEALARWVGMLGEVPADLRPFLGRGGEGEAALRRQLTRLAKEGGRAREAVLAAFARDRGVDAGRWQRLVDLVRPRGRPQERALSPVSLVARHGFEVFREGLSALDPLVPGHTLMHLP